MFDDPEASSRHNSQRMEFLILAIVLTLAGAQESQLEGPQNTLSVVGSTVTLKCLSPSRNCSGIYWQIYMHGTSNSGIFKGPSTMLTTNVTDRNRYSVDNSSGCDLVIKNVQLTDAGRFICSAIVSSSQETKTAYLIILETQPKCTLNVSLHDTVEGDGVRLNCAVSLNGTDNASMTWKGVEDAPAAVKNGKTISRPYSVIASAPEFPSFTCEASFAYKTFDNGVPIGGLATNDIPNAICSTSAIRVLYSVRDVTLSPSLSSYSPGTVITCVAKGYPSPTFKWQEKDPCGVWEIVQNCSAFSLTDVSSKLYRCVALNVVRGRSYSVNSPEIQFSSTDKLSATAISASEDRLGFHTIIGIGIGIGVGIGFIVAIILASIVFTILVRRKYLEIHPSPAVDRSAQHQDHEMSSSSRKHSAVDRAITRTGAPIIGEQESTYAGLGEDRDVNEYASLEQKQKAKQSKKSRP